MNAESYLLATLLAYPEAFGDVASIVNAEDFDRPAYREIYASMARLSARSVVFDGMAVKSEMEAEGAYSRIGGDSVLVDLIGIPVSSQYTATEHARTIADDATRRRAVLSLAEALEAAKDPTRPLSEVSGMAEKAAMEAAANRQSKDLRAFDDFLPEVWRRIEAVARGEITGIKTGFPDIDKHTGGFQKTDFVILGGRPGMGKTSLALEMGVNLSIAGGVVAFFECEMSAAQVVQRALYQKGRVNSQLLKRGVNVQQDLPRLKEAQERIRGKKIFFDDTTNITPLQMLSKCRKLKSKQGKLDLVIVDNVQIMRGDGSFRGDKRAELADVSNNLKRIAKDLDTVVIGISHLNRDSAKSSDPEPSLHDLKNTGEFEQDADIVILLHMESYYTDQIEPGTENEMKVIFAKFREGETGFVMIRFVKEFTAFETMSQRKDEPPKQKFDRNDWNIPS